MNIACWITKATNAHPEYVILIDFPLQQWLQEGASMIATRTLPVLFNMIWHLAVQSDSRIYHAFTEKGLYCRVARVNPAPPNIV
jgi:hypothetical protein